MFDSRAWVEADRSMADAEENRNIKIWWISETREATLIERERDCRIRLEHEKHEAVNATERSVATREMDLRVAISRQDDLRDDRRLVWG